MELTLNEWFSSGRGKLCEHSDKYVFTRNGRLFSGTRCNPRNLNLKPYSSDELARQARFKKAIVARAAIYADDTLKAAYRTRYRDAVKNGTTSCSSFAGYLVSLYFDGKISDTGTYVSD